MYVYFEKSEIEDAAVVGHSIGQLCDEASELRVFFGAEKKALGILMKSQRVFSSVCKLC